MKVLVTGCNGYIGAALTKHLFGTNFEVHGIDVSKPKFKDSRFMEQIDIRDASKDFLKQFDIIYHMAAQADIPTSIKNPEETFDINVNGTKNLLAGFKGKRFVFASSATVYNPQNPYAESKVKAEKLIHESHKPFTILRFFNVYGWGKDNLVVQNFMKRAINSQNIEVQGDGKQVRDFVYIKDIVEAVFLASIHLGTKNGTFDIGTGKSTSIVELIHAIEDITGKKLKKKFVGKREGDIESSVADWSKLDKAIGWKAKYSLEDGLRHMIEGR